jgi:PAS domain S-box-containing protein
MSPKFRSAALAMALATLTGAAIVVGARIIVHSVHRLDETDDWVVHSHQVLSGLQQLLMSLVDAETGERGFLITGEERFLEPYQSGRAAVQDQLAHLTALTKDDPARQQHLREIEPVAAKVLAQLERAIELRRARGFDAGRMVVLSERTRRLMEDIRGRVAAMVTQEQTLLEDRERASAAAARRAVTTTLLASVASFALLGFAFEVARRRLRERERSAVEAHEQKERFRTTLTSVGDAVVVTDERGIVTMMNPVAVRLLRCGDDAIGRPLDDVFRIVNEESRQPVESPVQRVLREGAISGLANHTVLLWPDGGEMPIDDSAAPIQREDGTVVGAVLVFRDIRERRQTERLQQRAAELLREQDRRKDQFLAALSHELRNPLGPMRNAVRVLQHTGATTEQWRRSLSALDRQVAHVARLVDDLLDISRIAQGKIRLQKDQVNLSEVVHRAVDDFQSVFAKRQIALEVRNGDDPLWVEADSTRLAQVAGNLLQNAAKFTDPGGRVTIALGKADDRARLEVRDDGAGIDAEALASLFQPFVQAEGTVRRSAAGLGLGLALSKSIVELHGGTVRASSAGPGKGAVFVVELPLLRNVAAPPPSGPGARPRRALRVLVVDDNEDAALTLRDLLELEHHEVLVAADAESGIAAALAHHPDVVLCDVGLPGMDGYEAARRLRSAGSTATLVALTGHASAEDVQQALEAGFDRHVAKPVDLDTLLGVLATVEGEAAGAPVSLH